MFKIFRTPYVSQRDNGRQFDIKIIEEICEMWNKLKIVHGMLRCNESQGLVQRANQAIEKMLRTQTIQQSG